MNGATMNLKNIILHCSASDWGTALVFDQWHRIERGWSGIGYHYVIENGFPSFDHFDRKERWRLLDGQISSGRAIDADDQISDTERGAHAYGFNTGTIGICLVGDKLFTKSQIVSLVKLVVLLCHNYRVTISTESIAKLLLGHCELPGVTKTWPNVDMNAIRKLVVNKSEGFHLFKGIPNVKEF